jgi:hypothetical protein
MSDKETLLKELKTHYNKLIKRYKAGVEYIDNSHIPIEEREKWVLEYKKLIEQLNGFLNEFEKIGVEVSDDETLNGFGQDKL